MRFHGNVIENLQAAAKSQDKILIKEILVDEMANIIESNPKEMIKTLRHSKVDISDSASKENLISAASYNLYNNPIFQKNLAVTLVMKGSASSHDYASSNGDTGKVASGGGADPVSAIANAIGSIANWGASATDLKAEEERTKGKLYEKIFGEKQKTNWMPIIVVGGVLLIGGIVAYITLKK